MGALLSYQVSLSQPLQTNAETQLENKDGGPEIVQDFIPATPPSPPSYEESKKVTADSNEVRALAAPVPEDALASAAVPTTAPAIVPARVEEPAMPTSPLIKVSTPAAPLTRGHARRSTSKSRSSTRKSMLMRSTKDPRKTLVDPFASNNDTLLSIPSSSKVLNKQARGRNSKETEPLIMK